MGTDTLQAVPAGITGCAVCDGTDAHRWVVSTDGTVQFFGCCCNNKRICWSKNYTRSLLYKRRTSTSFLSTLCPSNITPSPLPLPNTHHLITNGKFNKYSYTTMKVMFSLVVVCLPSPWCPSLHTCPLHPHPAPSPSHHTFAVFCEIALWKLLELRTA